MIKVAGLTKRFGHLTAVDGLSFEVAPGEVLGFLGPNGAGKSTTMKMLTGFLAPTSGSIAICGHDVLKDPVSAQAITGYLPEGAPSYSDMTVRSFLRFMGHIRGLTGGEFETRFQTVCRQVALETVLDQRIETLSKGFNRRVGLAQALLHDPRVLILDEPTDGLDPNQKHQVRELIRNLSHDKIVIISTHILEEVHAVCSRALIIAEGRIVADGTPEELARLSRFHHAVHVRFAEPCARAADFEELEHVASVAVENDGLGMTIFPREGANILTEVNHLIHVRDWPLEEFHVEKGRLDDVFRKLTTGEAA
ncbi:ATP-binding cassette domain-containing protein [Marinobacteraceae bacterium S3BR75-40.1]